MDLTSVPVSYHVDTGILPEIKESVYHNTASTCSYFSLEFSPPQTLVQCHVFHPPI